MTREDYARIAAQVRGPGTPFDRATERARPVAEALAAARGARYPDPRDWDAARNATRSPR